MTLRLLFGLLLGAGGWWASWHWADTWTPWREMSPRARLPRWGQRRGRHARS